MSLLQTSETTESRALSCHGVPQPDIRSTERGPLATSWQRAVDYYATHRGISPRSVAYRDLLGAKPTAAQVRRLTRQR